jgi:hypothetical protein
VTSASGTWSVAILHDHEQPLKVGYLDPLGMREKVLTTAEEQRHLPQRMKVQPEMVCRAKPTFLPSAAGSGTHPVTSRVCAAVAGIVTVYQYYDYVVGCAVKVVAISLFLSVVRWSNEGDRLA